MSIVSEFKEFAVKGNVVDLAVGVIIGGAFGKIVTSFVNDVVMPPIGMLLGGVDFSKLALVLKETGDDKTRVLLKYGVFMNTVIDFLIVALVIFSVVKVMNSMKRKEEEVAAEAPAPSNEEVLLAEIRDILKKK